MATKLLLSATALVLASLSVQCAVSEIWHPCYQKAFNRSSVSEEDKERTLEIIAQTFKEASEQFRQGNKTATSDKIFWNILSSDAGIKDKGAVKKFFEVLVLCLHEEWRNWSSIPCQEAQEANRNRLLTDKDLRKLIRVANAAFDESGGFHVPDDILKKKFTDALGSGEKGQVALKVHHAIYNCQPNSDPRNAGQ